MKMAKKSLGVYALNYAQRYLVREVVRPILNWLFPTFKSKLIVVVVLITLPSITGLALYSGFI